MIAHSSTSRQLPNAFQLAFDSLHIGHHLRRASITKNPRFSCRKFLLSLSTHTVQQVRPLTSNRNVRVLIVDDSVYGRGLSRAMELLAHVHDHTINRFVKGFRMVPLYD